MNTFGKWIVVTPVAAVMTAGLFMGMRGLISGEWQPQEKSRAQKFEINPVVQDLKIPEGRTRIQKLKRVETPPAPPKIAREQAAKPSEPIAKVAKAVPVFKMPKLTQDAFKLDISDRNAQPLVRIPPISPARFLEGNYSGHCRVRFDVSAEGSPYNVDAYSCTTPILSSATVKSVQKWRFNPKVLNGRNVAMTGVENRVTFRLLDEGGNLLPEPGY